MSQTVQLITEIGDQTINVGKCHPGQARILVKKGHAAWDDGKLKLALRPIHLAVALNHTKLDHEGNEVSNAELERRVDWLRSLVEAVVETDTHGSDLVAIAGPQDRDVRDGLKHFAKVTQEAKGIDQFRVTHADYLKEGVPIRPPPDLTDEELREWYDEEAKIENDLPLAELTGLWDRGHSHFFYGVFGIPDSTKVALCLEEPPPLRALDEADAFTLDVKASVVGHDNATSEFVKTDFGRWMDDVETLPVQFTLNIQRSPNARWPDPEVIGPIPVRCPTCGVGIDDDGDGNCGFCNIQARARVRMAKGSSPTSLQVEENIRHVINVNLGEDASVEEVRAAVERALGAPVFDLDSEE